MKINIPGKYYRVGGAVRDELLHYPSSEIDYVVVGTTPEAMIAAGFMPVGKSFPVFLHPHSKAEYALARSERKIGKGYHGFECHADPSVTLEEDLKRRDLTINAMAIDDTDGKLIDPYGGKDDLLIHKTLRHVSEAFAEDPVRILRAARFAARFAHLGFTVAPDTMKLMQQMVEAGEVNALVAERVWKETERAFSEQNPEAYIAVLRESGALKILFPELDATLSETRLAHLKAACALTSNPAIRFAALASGLRLINKNIPIDWHVIPDLLTDNAHDLEALYDLPAMELVNLLQCFDPFRREKRFRDILLAIEAIDGKEKADYLDKAYHAAAHIDVRAVSKGHEGLDIKNAIHKARTLAVDAWMKSR